MRPSARLAGYWYATAIVLVVSAVLRVVSTPAAVPMWVPIVELAAGVVTFVVAAWVRRGAPQARVAAIVLGCVLLAGAAGLVVAGLAGQFAGSVQLGVVYEFAAIPALLGLLTTLTGADAFGAQAQSAEAAGGRQVPAVAAWEQQPYGAQPAYVGAAPPAAAAAGQPPYQQPPPQPPQPPQQQPPQRYPQPPQPQQPAQAQPAAGTPQQYRQQPPQAQPAAGSPPPQPPGQPPQGRPAAGSPPPPPHQPQQHQPQQPQPAAGSSPPPPHGPPRQAPAAPQPPVEPATMHQQPEQPPGSQPAQPTTVHHEGAQWFGASSTSDAADSAGAAHVPALSDEPAGESASSPGATPAPQSRTYAGQHEEAEQSSYQPRRRRTPAEPVPEETQDEAASRGRRAAPPSAAEPEPFEDPEVQWAPRRRRHARPETEEG